MPSSLRLPGRIWRALPLDGMGLSAPRDLDLAVLRLTAARLFWQRAPRGSRLPLKALARLAWIGASFRQVRQFARVYPLRGSSRRQLLGDCLLSGARPNEAFIWRHFFSGAQPHPLPGASAARVLLQLGDASQHRLLSDKLAMSERLAAAGIATPPLLQTIARGQSPDLRAAIWREPGQLFVKPRSGAASRGCAAIVVQADGCYRINDGASIDAAALAGKLAAAAVPEELLVQPRLLAAADLQDLASSAVAPVLRLTTVREPGGAPFLHSALLEIAAPGEHPRDFMRGHIRVPIEIATGRMVRGIWFMHPGDRYERLPWNQAMLAGRAVPGWACAAQMAVDAMTLLPDLAIVNWDMIVTNDGPVMLEGNSGGNWILTQLSAVAGIETVALEPLLHRWLPADRPSNSA